MDMYFFLNLLYNHGLHGLTQIPEDKTPKIHERVEGNKIILEFTFNEEITLDESNA